MNTLRTLATPRRQPPKGSRRGAVTESTYTVNDLNQYIDRTVPDVVDVFGIANSTANVTVGITGGTASPAARHGEYYHHALTVGHDAYPEIEVQSLYGATASQTGHVFNPPATETYSHDDDGNLLQDGRWTYVWDGENRLIEMRRDDPTPAGAQKKLTFEYDWQGRRIRKTVFNYNNGWVEQSDTIFLYDGWNLIAELDANNGKQPLRTCVWGNDLSGTLQGAGGVGGLLKVVNHGDSTSHFVCYDGNGNVMGLVAATDGTVSARYDYGPFGEPLRATGPQAANPFRFSSKYCDAESGLYYYGYRYYDPITGRWLSRDPSHEAGGVNLYCFLHNRPRDTIDVLGSSELYYPPNVCILVDAFGEEEAAEMLNIPLSVLVAFMMQHDCDYSSTSPDPEPRLQKQPERAPEPVLPITEQVRDTKKRDKKCRKCKYERIAPKGGNTFHNDYAAYSQGGLRQDFLVTVKGRVPKLQCVYDAARKVRNSIVVFEAKTGYEFLNANTPPPGSLVDLDEQFSRCQEVADTCGLYYIIAVNNEWGYEGIRKWFQKDGYDIQFIEFSQ